ncbi:rho guanine nucleotide exchange factor 7-like isoform X6 [Mytilus galloprovincialis]|uniref:rho guanine nucleotide exchange factor 7-like isoform X6 n=2 Tax=Mytilus edulis TaxID=6550 RepID=UPI0039EE8B9D
MEKDREEKTPSTDLSGDFDMIVNEINEFINILEVRGQELEQQQAEENRQQSQHQTESEESEECDTPPFQSARNTIILVENNEEPIYETCHNEQENPYEAIPALAHLATVTASTSPAAKSQKPELKPKPKHLLKMVEPSSQNPKRVKALHNFSGSNNDELCFNKGDIITVTQMVEGGWWEGTLNGKTGWFPNNYTKEIKSDIANRSSITKGPDMGVYKRESTQLYHNVVFQNLIETEKTHVQEMTMVLQNYIHPLQNSGILTPVEYTKLVGNLDDILAFQNNFLSSIEDCMKQLPHLRRIGGVFMKHAPRLKELYLEYCSNHPRAVAIVQSKRDELNKYMEQDGAPPGAMILTTNLYKPFTRLDKYPSLLKELERHIEESHVDRGDTQRAIAIYRDVSNACMEIRKVKEMEYEILTSAIKGWEGEEMSKFGEVLHLSQVHVFTSSGEKYDRIFVLFPNMLVMLSMSPRLSGYTYEGQIPLSGLNVSTCDDEENFPSSFEISGNMIEKITVTCGTNTEVKAWLDHLKQQANYTSGTTKPQSLQVCLNTLQEQMKLLKNGGSMETSSGQNKPENQKISTSQPSISLLTKAKTAMVTHSTWSMSCLRPSPPLRQIPYNKEDGIRSPRMGRKPVRRKPVRTHSQDEYDFKSRWRQYDPRTMEEDSLILRVIEAYCTSAKTRNTVNSLPLKEVINIVKPMPTDRYVRRDVGTQAEEEKIIVDDGGDPTMLQEKSLVDTVYSLKDQVKALETEHKRMKRDLEEETKARKRLETNMKKFIKTRTDMLDENLM